MISTNPLQHAECLLFDYGGTLDANGIAWKEQFHAIYREEGLAIATSAFERAFYDADDSLVGILPSHAELPDTVRLLVTNLEERLGEDPCRRRRVVERFVANTSAAIMHNREVLETLHSRFSLGIVSNWYGNLAAVCRGLALDSLFDAIADSQVVGAGKPEPAIFHAAMTPLGAQPEKTVMIGDSVHRDGEGARGVGCGFVWLAPAHVADEPGVMHRITGLDALLGLLI